LRELYAGTARRDFPSPRHDAMASFPPLSGANGRSSAVDIILSDDTLRLVFLLGHAQSSAPATLSDERASRFLLWFALEGWRRYPDVNFSADYLDFLSAPIPPCASRLATYVLFTKPELRSRFSGDVERFHDWYYDGGAESLGLSPFLSARERDVRRAAQQRDPGGFKKAGFSRVPGVNIFGFGDSIMGVGEDARALAAALRYANIPCALINLSLPSDGVTDVAPALDLPKTSRPIFPINIFTLPPFETARLRIERGRALFQDRYSIGYWPWELTSLPDHWKSVFDLVDEVWAASDFLEKVYSGLTDKPVILMPPHVHIPDDEPVDLSLFGLSRDDFIVLSMFDYNSFIARKNPDGALAAFQKAFPSHGKEKLIIKTINADAHPDAARHLATLAAGEKRCVIINKPLSRAQILGLIKQSACFISLHRAEGFGRVIAEAMALGTPVAATDWSGSACFLDATRGYPVSYALRDVEAGEYPFRDGSQWAEPSIADAANKLRVVRANRDPAITSRARAFIRDHYGIERVASKLTERLKAIEPRVSSRQ